MSTNTFEVITYDDYSCFMVTADRYTLTRGGIATFFIGDQKVTSFRKWDRIEKIDAPWEHPES